MVIKVVKPVFLKVLSIVIVVLFLNIGYFLFKSVNLSQGVTGFSIKDSILNSYSTMSLAARIFLVIQWSFLILILLFAIFRDKRVKAESIRIPIQKAAEKNKTDLDTLYEVLKEKKELAISTIAKSFNVEKDIAMEWCRILESGDLITIDYPGFSSPIAKINEKNFKNINPEKIDVKKDILKIKKEIEVKSPKELEKNLKIKKRIDEN